MPKTDLIQVWEEHTNHEFGTRDTDATLPVCGSESARKVLHPR